MPKMTLHYDGNSYWVMQRCRVFVIVIRRAEQGASKAVTYNERPKMKKTAFSQASLFIFEHLSYIRYGIRTVSTSKIFTNTIMNV